MYCRMCGNKLDDTDHYCPLCGTPTGSKEPTAAPAEKTEIKEEVVFNPPYENKSRFAGEEPERAEEAEAPDKGKVLKEFISDHEIEAAQKTANDAGPEQEPAKDSEFTWNVYEFPTAKRKTEDIEFNWNMGESGQPEKKDAEAAAFEEELFQEIREDAGRIREQNIDRFFTFSKKNEEFQELLDREYDKIKSRSEPVPPQKIHTEIIPAEPSEPPEAEEPIETEEPAEPMETEEPVVLPEIEEAVVPPEVEEPAEPAEPSEPSEVEAPAEPAEPVEPAEVEEPAEPAEPVEPPEVEEPAELPEIEEAVVPPETEEQTAEALAEVRSESEALMEPQEAPKAEHLSEMSRARAQYFRDELIRDNASIRKSMEPHDTSEADQAHETPEAAEQGQEEDIDRTPEQKPVGIMPNAFVPDEGEEEPHKRSVGQIVLSIIAVILVVEIIILGIRYFAPDSAAARAIGNAQTGIFETVAGFTDSISGWFSTDNSKDETTPEDSDKNTASSGAIEDGQSAGQGQTDNGTAAQTPTVPDPDPMADKNALVTSQLGNNSNIQQVKANEALAYQPGKNYGLSDVNNSKPITNNIWLAPEGSEPVYYDKSVVGTVIAFDSQWIDYVNGSSRSVLDLLKKDSKAYQNTLGYSKIGKVKETFKLLELGEIRQGAKGFYVWVHEEISITEKGATSDKEYNWIYYLEPSDGKMQIVNYFKF